MAITSPRVSVHGVHRQQPSRQVPLSLPIDVPNDIGLRHFKTINPKQFTSASCKKIEARMDLISGTGEVGSIRCAVVHRNLPGKDSIERLDILDDDVYATGFSIIGGDNNLKNYSSVVTLHPADNGEARIVVESYVVDAPAEWSPEACRVFVNTVIHFNMIMLAARSYDEAGIVKPPEELSFCPLPM